VRNEFREVERLRAVPVIGSAPERKNVPGGTDVLGK